MGFFIGTSRFAETWVRGSCLHLDDNQHLKRNLKIKICAFLALLQEFELN
jgi:hypothetical protein